MADPILIYTGRTAADAQLMAEILRANGMEPDIRGAPMWTSHEPRLSPKPVTTTIWIDPANADAARALLDRHQQPPTDNAAEWTCAGCGERSPDGFETCWNCGQSPGLPAAETSADAAPEPANAPGSAQPVPSLAESPPADRIPWTFPWGNLLITVICVLVWYGLSNEPNPQSDAAMTKWGWRSAHDVWGGAYWSLLTAAFMHADAPHLWGNLLWLWILGLRLEHLLGTWRWLAFVVASAVVSISVDQAWLGEHSYGASGISNAAFGLFVVAGLTRRLLPWWLVWGIALWFFWGGTRLDLVDLFAELSGREVLDPVANICHLAGAVFGGLVGMACLANWKRRGFQTALAIIVPASLAPLIWAPWSFEWTLGRAEVERSRDRDDLAMRWWDRAIQLRPEDPQPYAKRAHHWLQRRRFDQAMADAETAVQRERALRSSSSQPEQQDDPDRNVSRMEGVAAESGTPPHPTSLGLSYVVRGQIRLAIGRHHEAIQDLTDALALFPDDPQALGFRAQAFLEQGRFGEAWDDLYLALRLAPNDDWLLLLRASLLRQRHEPFAAVQDAQTVYDQLLPAGPETSASDDPPSEPPPEGAENGPSAIAGEPAALALLAWALMELADDSTAEAVATSALAGDPDDWETRTRRAWLRLRLDKPAEALTDAEEALRVNPKFAEAWTVKAAALQQLDRIEESLEASRRSLSINPLSPTALFVRGIGLFQQGNAEEAIKDLNRAIERNPRYADAYRVRALVHRNLGDRASAEADAKIAAVLDPAGEKLPDNESP